jgi:hypothetical protein
MMIYLPYASYRPQPQLGLSIRAQRVVEPRSLVVVSDTVQDGDVATD